VPLPALLTLAALLLLLLAVGVLLVRTVRGSSRDKHRPPLAEVADRSTGVLACPVCRGVSFQSPPAGGNGFFALALGPFVFGSMSSRSTHLVECVTCGATFRRGVYAPVAVPLGSSSP
jgi:hypothetical protein